MSIKRLCRILAPVLAFLLLCLSLGACTTYTTRVSGTNVAVKDVHRELIEGFLTALATGDTDAACALMHPSRGTTAEELTTYVRDVELAEGIRWKDGVEVLAYTSYVRRTSGSAVTHEITADVCIGDPSMYYEMKVEILSDDNGEGIYNIHLTTYIYEEDTHGT